MLEVLKQQLNVLYDFRYNSVKRVVEYRIKGTKKFFPITSLREKLTILNRLRKSLASLTMKQLDEVLMDPSVSYEIDPFVEYFNSLPDWNGVDWIKQLCETVSTDDDQFWKIILRKFLLGMVKGLIEPDFVNQFMLVFVGGQGIGKSTWLNRLVPDALKEYIHSGPIEPKNKDDVRKLAECMLINLDELDAMGRQNSARLKELITRSTINQRKPYGVDNEIFTRRASFVASLNNYQFLHDQTGNRRFWVLKVQAIDLEVNVDIDQMYAQVYHEVKRGGNPHLNALEADRINERNQSFVSMNPIEEAIHSMFSQGGEDDGIFFRATDVANEIKTLLGFRRVSHGFATQVGTALGKTFQKRRKGNHHGYYLRKRIA